MGADQEAFAAWYHAIKARIKEVGDAVARACEMKRDAERDTKKNAKATIEWDGTASFLMSAELIAPVMTHIEHTPETSYDGITDFKMYYGLMHASQGQMTLTKLTKIKQVLETVPDLSLALFSKHQNPRQVDAERTRREYIDSLPRDDKPTLFLDEPDRSLSIPLQRQLFFMLLPELSKRYQIICATHSPMCFYTHGAIYHDLQKGYLEDSQLLMHHQFGDGEMKPMPIVGKSWEKKNATEKDAAQKEAGMGSVVSDTDADTAPAKKTY